MSQDNLKKDTVKGVIWSAVERFSVQGVQFLVMLVIARILSPKDYGLVGMLAIFLAIAQSLIDSGFSQALIRKKDRTEADNSTVFYFNFIISLVMYVALFFSAPLIADFYNEPQLTDLTRVIGIVVIVNGLAVVQRAIYTIEINFKVQARASLAGAVVSGAIGILLAIKGAGVWTLVWQQLLNAAITTVLLWVFSSWHPHLLYSWKSFREMFTFGSKLMLSGLLNTIYTNLYQLVIGKVFTASSLGYYSRANQFAQFPSSNLTGILQRVVYPILCKVQDDHERYVRASKKFLCLSCYIIFPLMCLLAGISKPLIIILLGEKWSFAGTLMIPICISMMWYPAHALNLNAITVIGRSDLFLRLEIIKKIIGVTVLAVSVPFGLLVLCYSSIPGTLLGLYVNSYYTGKEVGYDLLKQLKDLTPTLLLSLSIMLICFGINYLVPNVWLATALDIIIGCVVFVTVSYIFKFKEISYIKELITK